MDEAAVARGALEQEGIETFLANEYMVTLVWTLSQATGGVRLSVASKDAERARKILGSAADATRQFRTMAAAASRQTRMNQSPPQTSSSSGPGSPACSASSPFRRSSISGPSGCFAALTRKEDRAPSAAASWRAGRCW